MLKKIYENIWKYNYIIHVSLRYISNMNEYLDRGVFK